MRSSDNVYTVADGGADRKLGRDKALALARGVVANMARDPQGGDIDQIRAIAAVPATSP